MLRAVGSFAPINNATSENNWIDCMGIWFSSSLNDDHTEIDVDTGILSCILMQLLRVIL